MSLPVNALDDRIELKGRTGSGAMGEVHRAWDDQLERAVAVKFQLAAEGQEAERLLLEARLQARVEHPNVIKVHEVGTLQGRVCIVFQLVDGPTLGELAGELTIAERVELLRQAALGLHAAHLQGLVHRDVKPGNVLVETGLDGARRALLGDFGLARAEEGGLTRTGVPTGTLEYMSPEQLLGNGPVDFRSDVYALGATLYALLAGRPPFRGSTAGEVEASSGLFRRVLEEEPEPLHRLSPGTPRELGVVAARAMEKSPAARYRSAEAFAEELGRFLRGEPILAQPHTLLDRGVKWARRNRTAARALAGAAVALLAAAGLAAWSSRRASLEALEAAQLGASAASLESRLRMEYLSEPHDLRPTMAAVKAEVERFRPLAQRGSGPASYALGKGLELLDDLDGARAAYERARELGFRTPFVSEALGVVLGRIHGREWTRAQQGLGPADRTARLAALAAELVEPARRLLAEGDSSGWRGPWLQATLASMEGDHPAARAFAAQVTAADPARYEARLLEGRSWLDEGQVRYAEDRQDDAITAFDQAIAAFEAARRGGRSDPDLPIALAEARYHKSEAMVVKGLDPSREVERALAALDDAVRLDPEAARVHLIRGLALGVRGTRAMLEGRADSLPTLQASEGELRKAIEADRRDVAAYTALSLGIYMRAVLLQAGQQQPSGPVLQEGLEVSAAGLALAPRVPTLLRARAVLLFQLGSSLQEEGKEATAPLTEAVRLCDEAVALEPGKAASYRQVRERALAALAKEAWRAGRDPRPAFARAVEAGEELLRTSQGRASATTQLGETLGELAFVRLDMGEDPKVEAERAVALAAPPPGPAGQAPAYLLMQAQYLTLEAIRRSVVGDDPSVAVARARDLVTRATRNASDIGPVAEVLGVLALCQARGLAARGLSPLGELDLAERQLGELAGKAPTFPPVRKELAQVALERALWLRRSGASPVAAARAGLVHAAKGAELDPREAHVAILQARLQLLAGEPAPARQSLDRAYAIQPLVKGSREARAAEAELKR